MAQVVVLLEDKPDGTINVSFNPTCQQIVGMAKSGEKMTNAHGLALKLANTALKYSDRKKPDGKLIHVPKGRW